MATKVVQTQSPHDAIRVLYNSLLQSLLQRRHIPQHLQARVEVASLTEVDETRGRARLGRISHAFNSRFKCADVSRKNA